MARTLLVAVASLLAALVVASGGVAVAAAQDSGDKMTICHIPPGNPGGARTMEVSRSSWSAHEGHGDHKGACTAADTQRPASQPAQPRREAPKTPLALSMDGDGEIDGDASFKVVVANQGSAPGVGVQLVATLRGEGDWRVRSADGIGCSVDGRTVTCGSTDVPADGQASFRIDFEGQPSVCREVSVEVRMTAANDSSVGDDRSASSVWVGACSPLDHDGLA